jgi:thiamine transporter ThiT
MGLSRDKPFKFLPHQLSMVVYWTTMAFTGNGGLGFDSGEGA